MRKRNVEPALAQELAEIDASITEETCDQAIDALFCSNLVPTLKDHTRIDGHIYFLEWNQHWNRA